MITQPPPVNNIQKKEIHTNNLSSGEKQEETPKQPPRKSMDIQGDLKSALKNKFKNVKTGDESD